MLQESVSFLDEVLRWRSVAYLLLFGENEFLEGARVYRGPNARSADSWRYMDVLELHVQGMVERREGY